MVTWVQHIEPRSAWSKKGIFPPTVHRFLTFHDTPRVQTPTHPLALGLHHRIAADHSKRNAVLGDEEGGDGELPLSH